MISANKELRSVIGQQKADVKLSINPLSMKLQGIVEAAVMGGTANYQKVLLAHSSHVIVAFRAIIDIVM